MSKKARARKRAKLNHRANKLGWLKGNRRKVINLGSVR